jgi:hypothetical protein
MRSSSPICAALLLLSIGITASACSSAGTPSASSPPPAQGTPSATQIATVTTIPTSSSAATQRPAFTRPNEPGDALPDSLLGPWYDASIPAFAWILRSGDPYCTQALSSAQDCAVWELADGSGHLTKNAVATVIDGKLQLKWLTGPCTSQTSRLAYALTGDRLTLTWVSGSCISGDFALAKPGTGDLPTAPPEPQPS